MSARGTQSHWKGIALKTIAGLMVVFVILVIGLGVGVAVLNSQWATDRVEKWAGELTGREVNIGSFDLDLGRIITLRVDSLTVANPAWASKQLLASIDAIEVALDALALLRGDFVVTNVHVEEPVANLERSPTGKTNWSFATDTVDPIAQPESEGGGLALPRIEKLAVDGGRLSYHDPKLNTSLALKFRANARNKSSDGTIEATGEGLVFGEPLEVELSGGSPLAMADATDDYPIALAVTSEDTRLQLDGKLGAPLVPETADLKFSLQGKALARWNKVFDTSLPALSPYRINARATLADDTWVVDKLDAVVGESDLAARLRILTDSKPIRIEGELQSNRLDIAQLQRSMPAKDDSGAPLESLAAAVDLIAHAPLNAELNYRADLIVTGELPIHDTEIALVLDDGTLAVESLSAQAASVRFAGDARVAARAEPAGGRVNVTLEGIELSDAMAGFVAERDSPQDSSGTLAGELAVSFEVTRPQADSGIKRAAKSGGDSSRTVQLGSLRLEQLEIRYENPSVDTRIVAGLQATSSASTTILAADGSFRGAPLALSLTAPAIQELAAVRPADDAPMPLQAELRLGAATLTAEGSMSSAWPPKRLQLEISAQSESPSATASLFGVTLPSVGEASLSGSLVKQVNSWRLSEFQGVVGESDLRGSATVSTGDGLTFEAELKSTTLDVASLVATDNGEGAPDAAPDSRGETTTEDASEPRPMPNISGTASFHAQRLIVPGALLKNLAAEVTVADGQLLIEPLTFALGGGEVGMKLNLDLSAPTLVGDLAVDITGVDVDRAMHAQGLDAPELGTVNGRMALSRPPVGRDTPASFGPDAVLDRLRIDKLRLRYDDPALAAKTDLRLRAKSLREPARVNGTVEFRGQPMDIRLATGPLQQALDDPQSLPLDATLALGETRVRVETTIGKLLPIETLTATVTLEGPDPARLGEALDLSLPHLPPYRLHARLQRGVDAGEDSWALRALNGTVGDSDVTGRVRVRTGGERPLVFARLRSRKLDFDDLAGLIGAPPDPDESASAKQEAQAEAFENRARVLPDKRLDLSQQLRVVDADVEFRAKRIEAPKLPLDDLVLKMRLNDGYMQMQQLDFGVASGTASALLDVDARKVPVQAKLTSEFDGVNLNELLDRVDTADDSFGIVGGRGAFWLRGGSVAHWLGSADGGMYLTMTGGKLDALLLELAGLDFMESAAAFLGSESEVGIECAYADLQARSGIVTVEHLLLDTADTKFKGRGTIDLDREALDVTVEPHPQDFSLLSSRGPLHVGGTFKDPSFSVSPSFPSPEFGVADDSARCSGLMAALRKARQRQ